MSDMSHDAEILYLRAREITDLDERARFLETACRHSPGLRADVERRLADEERAGACFSGMEGSATTVISGTASVGDDAEQPGQQIGNYTLLEKLGEGGFGSVWRAAQTEPVRREVALKIIKQGMDTREVVARFDAERQALALMEHPNIAKVFDAGATRSGRPFFVMELVKGLPINQFCNKRGLNLDQRLALFNEVCAAVNHAHQKGIIHRDLKPSNVMVSVQGDTPVPKVIDFGIAKATQDKLTEKTFHTRFEQLLGTPAYMSPEQADMKTADVDTRSDIYSLGVLLYEMLTGHPPFDPRSLLAAGYDEMRRIIREDEPPKPSLRLGTLKGTARDSLQTTHGASPDRLERQLRGELDWIVMKAIDKDRSRRYETANAFAEDIRRYRDQEAILAAAPSAGYRLRKFARRHKAAISITVFIAVVLVTATTVSAVQAVKARDAEAKSFRLLQETLAQKKQLEETIALLTESTEELASHMRRFLIGQWEMSLKFDPSKARAELGEEDFRKLKPMFDGMMGDFSSRLEFREDGSSTGTTVVPRLAQAMMPLLSKERIVDGTWGLIKQHGKRTTVKITARGLGGIRHSSEFTMTVVNSDTLEMEDSRWESMPFKPIVMFNRIQ